MRKIHVTLPIRRKERPLKRTCAPYDRYQQLTPSRPVSVTDGARNAAFAGARRGAHTVRVSNASDGTEKVPFCPRAHCFSGADNARVACTQRRRPATTPVSLSACPLRPRDKRRLGRGRKKDTERHRKAQKDAERHGKTQKDTKGRAASSRRVRVSHASAI